MTKRRKSKEITKILQFRTVKAGLHKVKVSLLSSVRFGKKRKRR